MKQSNPDLWTPHGLMAAALNVRKIPVGDNTIIRLALHAIFGREATEGLDAEDLADIRRLARIWRKEDARSPIEHGLCSDCPPVGYPTDETRCWPCPRRPAEPLPAESDKP